MTAFLFGDRTPILDWPYRRTFGPNGRPYDVLPDGQRFLALKDGGTEGTTPQIIVVQNWFGVDLENQGDSARAGGRSRDAWFHRLCGRPGRVRAPGGLDARIP